MKTTVILVRHGITDWNKLKKLQGKSDIPLNPEGIMQAKSVAKRLKKEFPITKIYSSNLLRAIKTGEIIGKELGMEIEKHEGLNERDYGEFEGKTWEELGVEFTKEKRISFRLKPKKGEHYPDFQNRVVKHFLEIVKKHTGETILLVCHGGVLNALLRHINSIPYEDISHYSFPNTSVTILHIEKDVITPHLVADIEHLG